MNRKLQHMHPALVCRKGSILLHNDVRPQLAQMTLQKLNKLCYETLTRPTDLSATEYLFMREKVFYNQSAAENAFREFIDSRMWEF
ncbi:Histone-lysine N-methyltransferase SETMAR [Araneus ventricosus]|uniref:Histone-lysine N-methyltransferase SETMAR n=1 Tax=Araneus ventricosus TaxID=182803 RepID=A0A4Y2L4V2_ARAVE|nr:Histone-lysine N-methyltransferase SETMAR [Araneus ventricosus]